MARSKSVIFLTTALVMTVTWGVGASGWANGLNIVIFVGLGSILIGIMLARGILPGPVAHLFGIIIGIGWSFWVTSRLLPVHYTWLQRWENLIFRLNYWYSQAISGGTSYDNLMFILQMGLIIWIMGHLTTWLILRAGRVWSAIVPGGVILIINLYYAPNDITIWFFLYLLIALLLTIRFNTLHQELKWRREGVFFKPDISFGFLRNGLIFSLLVVGLAWLAPPAVDAKSLEVLDEVQGTWRELQGEWNRLFADLNYRNRVTIDTFGQSLTLGGPRNLTDDPVMAVNAEGVGRYWRAAVYDEYTGLGWRSNDAETGSLDPGEWLTLPAFDARQPVTQTYTLYQNGTTVLYTMSNPVGLDRSAKIRFNALPTEQVAQRSELRWLSTEEPWIEEITYIRSNATVDEGESYQVVSMASQATVDQLRAADADYPAWVTERYLQLPETITERTRQLARDLTNPYDNSFDKAQAIEHFLRTELKYNEKIAAPPPDVEKVDYILFELREAYCDYYASAMIVMLRSLGIPARLAAGFAQGKYDSQLDAFKVLNRDAHSWVEVYFPRYGWIEFEPTAAQPNIIRPTAPEKEGALATGPIPNRDNLANENSALENPENIPVDEEAMASINSFTLGPPWLEKQVSLPGWAVKRSVTVTGTLLIILVAGSVWWRRQWLQPPDNIFDLYQRMVHLARWMGVTLRPWQTPFEYAAILQRKLPSHRREVESIIGEYVFQTFGPRNSASPEQAELLAASPMPPKSSLAWNRLRAEMVTTAIVQRLPGRLTKIVNRLRRNDDG